MTQITNDNIEHYVNLYMTNREELPDNLKVINDWDVRSVTNMSNLFLPYPTFNEPLDKWDVSNVENK